MKMSRLLCLVGVVTIELASLCYADPILPTGLTNGEQYRIVFVTADTITATSSDIDVYNAFAAAEAALNPELAALGTTWTAIASTGSPDGPNLVNAIDNIGVTGAAVYNTDGLLVASNDGTGVGGLWNGVGIQNPIEYDQNGNLLSTYVWTGTSDDGDAFPAGDAIALGQGGDSVFGDSFVTEPQQCYWGCGGWVSDSYTPNGDELSLYAISGELTYEAPGSVPEPGTISLMLLGGTFLVRKLRKMRTSVESLSV